jgi:transcriptional regulator with XRE-family HTH domain
VKEQLYISFGQNIRDERKNQQLSQEDFGALCSMGRATIANIEAGKQSVTLDQVYKFCIVLNVSLENLLPPINPKTVITVEDKLKDQMNLQDLATLRTVLDSNE